MRKAITVDNSVWRWLVIVILLAHGIGHIIGLLESWTSIPAGFTNQPWILSDTVTIESAVGRVFGLLWLAAMIAFLGAGIGLFTHQEWWRIMTVGAAVISLVAILPWWNTVTPEARLGAIGIDLAFLVALLPLWGESLAHSIQ
jgi:cytochrome c biogenesis protein CcdA